MDSALAMLRNVVIIIFAFGAMISYWLNHIAETTADRYATAAAHAIRDRLTNLPSAAPGGRAGCPLIPTDPAAWNQDLPGGGIAQAAWDAAVAADHAIGRRVQNTPRYVPHVTPGVTERAGFARITPGPAGEDCELYVHVAVTPLGARLPLFDSRSTVCIDYTTTQPPRPCVPQDLAT